MAAKTRLGPLGYGQGRRGSFAGKRPDLGIVRDDWIDTLATLPYGVKKPGIPTDAPDWLKTTLEIMLGRRGNTVEIPAPQTLTFSSTPTKAECEALYRYVNTIQGALDELITRFDS